MLEDRRHFHKAGFPMHFMLHLGITDNLGEESASTADTFLYSEDASRIIPD